MVYYGCENRSPLLDSRDPGRSGVHRERRQPAADSHNGRTENGFAGSSESVNNDTCQWEQTQNSLQDSGERLAVLLDARPVVVSVLELYLVIVEDPYASPFQDMR